MIILGALLLILGFVLGIGILYTLGIILLIIGVILFAVSAAGTTVGPRRYYW